ncbi:S8 family serine peptidase [Fredinandcohnia sp. 179-A 10B2 NHS]|uniref:S8 family serine peptidase n=1 Tax=Fredinandcohnia sp. 179-A 10B2 NHS TaxID=3235176 RepID=UPI00399F0307
MKKIITFVMVAFLLLSNSPLAIANDSSNVLILFKEEIDIKAIKKLNGEILFKYDQLQAVSAEVPVSAIPLLLQDENIISVEEDLLIEQQVQQIDWGIASINAPSAWNSTLTGKGIKIAVLDSGISAHPDLRIEGGISFVSYTNSYEDDNGHGTHVAGIIGALDNGIGVIGVAPESSIYAVKVLDQEGSGYVSEIVAGINWSITNKMDIINLSLATTEHSMLLKAAVDKAYAHGILVVAAAGNNGSADGNNDTVEFPARYPSVIAVSAIDKNNIRGIFSATGSTIEIAAPGVSILSTYIGNGYVTFNGTSMATPFISGILAQLKNAYPTLSNVALREKLQQGAIDLGQTGKDSFYGYGLAQSPKKDDTTQVTEQVTGGWNYKNGSWYYYDSNGELVKGWLKENNTWYYLTENGAMKTGWLFQNGKWYFLTSSGAMKSGWLLDNSKWYFLDSNGAMKTGWTLDKKDWYYLQSTGEMKTGWVLDKNNWYYLSSSGKMLSGWIQDNNKWYFLDSSGSMFTGWRLINGAWYYFYSNGEMATNTVINNYKIDSNGVWIQ